MITSPCSLLQCKAASVVPWPSGVSRQPRDHLRPGTTTTLMAPTFLQQQQEQQQQQRQDGKNKLLVVVCSAVGNRKERESVRRSWASPELTPEGVRVAFLLGRAAGEGEGNSSSNNSSNSSSNNSNSNSNSPAADEDEELAKEQAIFGDIIQVAQTFCISEIFMC